MPRPVCHQCLADHALSYVTEDPDTKSDKAAAVLVEKIVRDMYAAKGSSEIQPLQWSILRYLERTPPSRCTMTRIRQFIGLTHAPVIRAINTLARRGLVGFRENPADARSRIIHLTEKGKEALLSDPILGVALLIRNLPEGERAQFKRLVRALSINAENG